MKLFTWLHVYLKHLENVNLKAVGGEIDIQLGLDHADLLVPLDVKMGKPQEPVAKRTSFGWMAVGLVGKPRGDIHSYHVAKAVEHRTTRCCL